MSEVACFGEVDTIKANLNRPPELNNKGDGANKWDKMWAVLWKCSDGWRFSVWNNKDQWKHKAAPLATIHVSKIRMLTTATIGDKKHVLKLKFDDSREWVFNLPSNGVVDKWSETVREKISLYLKVESERGRAATQKSRWNTHGWESDEGDESLEQLNLFLVKCMAYRSLLGPCTIIICSTHIRITCVRVQKVWKWAWSDIEWFCMDTGAKGEKVVDIQIKRTGDPGGCVFSWTGPSVARLFSLLTEHIATKRIEPQNKERGISVAEESLTDDQFAVLIKEPFPVVISCASNNSYSGKYSITFTRTSIEIREYHTKVVKWVWLLTDIKEFTLEADGIESTLVVQVECDGVKLFTLSGERMAILFLVVKELTSRLAAEMERERSCCTAIECQNGISLLVSARVKDLMKIIYCLKLVECHQHDELLGSYEMRVSQDALQLSNIQNGNGWIWKLDHIRRFLMKTSEERTTLLIESGRRSVTGEGIFVFSGDAEVLTQLCWLLKMLMSQKLLVVKLEKILIEIKKKILIKLRKAKNGELLDTVAVDVSPGLTRQRRLLRIYPTKIQLARQEDGEIEQTFHLSQLDQISLQLEDEKSNPAVIISATAAPNKENTLLQLDSTDNLALYAQLQVLREHYGESQLQASTVSQSSDYLVLQIKNGEDVTICEERCILMLEDQTFRLHKLSDSEAVIWQCELIHLKGMAMEEYSDGLGVLLIKTLKSCPHEGQDFYLLCNNPEQLFMEMLQYTEEHGGKGILQEQVTTPQNYEEVHSPEKGPSKRGPHEVEEQQEGLPPKKRHSLDSSVLSEARKEDNDMNVSPLNHVSPKVCITGAEGGPSWSLSSVPSTPVVDGEKYILPISEQTDSSNPVPKDGLAASSSTSLESTLSDDVFAETEDPTESDVDLIEAPQTFVNLAAYRSNSRASQVSPGMIRLDYQSAFPWGAALDLPQSMVLRSGLSSNKTIIEEADEMLVVSDEEDMMSSFRGQFDQSESQTEYIEFEETTDWESGACKNNTKIMRVEPSGIPNGRDVDIQDYDEQHGEGLDVKDCAEYTLNWVTAAATECAVVTCTWSFWCAVTIGYILDGLSSNPQCAAISTKAPPQPDKHSPDEEEEKRLKRLSYMSETVTMEFYEDSDCDDDESYTFEVDFDEEFYLREVQILTPIPV